MLITFDPKCSLEEYAKMGRDFDFPKLERCPNRKCRSLRVHRHGFYQRNCSDGHSWYRIPIRRYYCPHCGTTVSFLPLFCLPWFQYGLMCLMKCLIARFLWHLSLKETLDRLKAEYPKLSWSVSQLHRYLSRFLANIPRIELVLRSVNPRCLLGQSLDKTKRAKKVLDMIIGFPTIQSFSKLFADQCHCSFLAPIHSLV